MASALSTQQVPEPTARPLLSAAEIRQRYAGAFKPKPWIFWSDLVASAAVGWTAYVLAVFAPLGSVTHGLASVVAILGLMRGALFIHELAHLKRGAVRGFEVGWHLLIGIPLQLPSLMYVGSHHEHHRRAVFGTSQDPEYAPIARWSRLRLLRSLLDIAFVPLALPLRFSVLGPLSFAVPPLRRLLVARASTLVINPDYRRPMPTGEEARRWAIQEAAVAAFFWAYWGAVALGWAPLQWAVQYLIVTFGILVLNQLRTLAAHGYEHEGRELSTEEQLLDSINLSGMPLVTALLAPVGLRFHALHHFLPAIPYHALGGLHRQLSRELPGGSAYHRAERDGLVSALSDLWQDASGRRDT
ncbi:MAG: fatty acid desaturase [Proteobacteria bacterium]|nr:fatty acid desaturase [Pseudomonadota bacterium]